MQDKEYQKALKSYSLETLLDITGHIDREVYPHRFEWIQSEIDSRTKGIAAEPSATVPEFTFGTEDIYAGFWYRLAATLLDVLLVYVPLGFWFKWSFLLPPPYSLLVLLPLPLVFPVYNITCLAIWGQTPGKMAVGIKVISQSGTTVGLRRAASRHCVDSIMAVLMLTTLLVGLSLNSSSATSQSSAINAFHRQLPSWDLLDDLWDIWIWSEAVVLLFSQHKKGLHDFLAGTFVVHRDKLKEFQADVPEAGAGRSTEGRQQRLLTSIHSLLLRKLRSIVSSSQK
jgi:uncharacterized RDD family membrane protein YckC